MPDYCMDFEGASHANFVVILNQMGDNTFALSQCTAPFWHQFSREACYSDKIQGSESFEKLKDREVSLFLGHVVKNACIFKHLFYITSSENSPMISLGFTPTLTSPIVNGRKNLFAYLLEFLEDPSHQVQLIQCKYFPNWHIQILYIPSIYERKKSHFEEQFGTQLDLIWSFANTPFLNIFHNFQTRI